MDYILVGNSGHAKVIRDSIETSGDRVFAILDDRDAIPSMDDDIFRGPISELSRLLEIDERRVIITYSDNGIRKQLVEFLNLPDEQYGTIIHPNAIVGNHSILNSMSVVEHEGVLKAYVHVSTGAVITREVTVEEGASLGANSTVIPNRKIGEWSIVGAGSSVIADLPAGCTAVGCPARILDKEE